MGGCACSTATPGWQRSWIGIVHPDADFECMGVLMEHTQDVKCVAWHPIEEVRFIEPFILPVYIDDTAYRSSPRHHMTIP